MPRGTRSDEQRIDAIVSKQLRLFRVASHLSQTELGERVNVTFQQIQKYEKGVNSMPSGRLRMICKVLGITPNDLFGLGTSDHNIPSLSAWACRLAFKLDKLDAPVRSSVGHLVEGLLEHQATAKGR